MSRAKRYVNNDEKNIGEVKSPAEVETTGPHTKNGIVTNTLYVKVRKEPTSKSGVLEVLRKGDKVTITKKVGQYYQVSTNSNPVAYISSDFIEIEEE